jgi:hypothetical protein
MITVGVICRSRTLRVVALQPGIRRVHELDHHRERFGGLIDLVGGKAQDVRPGSRRIRAPR